MSAKGEATKGRLLAVADEIIYRRGYSGASFEELVSASGIRRGNIYHYFRTKDELLAAVIERRVGEVRAALAAWETEAAAPLERLHRFADMVLGREADLVASGCPIGTLAAELGKGAGPGRRLVRELFDVYCRWLARELRALGWPAPQAKEKAIELIARCQGAALVVHAYGDRALLRRQIASVRGWIDQLGNRRATVSGTPAAPRPRRDRPSRASS